VDRAVSDVPARALHALRVRLVRVRYAIGTPGVIGCLMIVVAAATWWSAWRSHPRVQPTVAQVDERTAWQAGSASGATAPRRVLPEAADVPRLLQRVERAAVAAGLGWPRADYRFNPAADDMPASVEARCTLKGPYPAVRRFVTMLLLDTPALTLKEFSLSRGGADVADVEAKLALVVFVAGSPATVRP
jgi:hypothetical protein